MGSKKKASAKASSKPSKPKVPTARSVAAPTKRAKKPPFVLQPAVPVPVLQMEDVGDVPTLAPIDPTRFTRSAMISRGGYDGALQSALALCVSLSHAPLEDRKGVLYVQVDEPVGGDTAKNDSWWPSDPVLMVLTGSRLLAMNGMKRSAKLTYCTEQPFTRGHFKTLPVWAVVQDNHFIMQDEGYFHREKNLAWLQRGRWKISVLESNAFDMFWGGSAGEALAALPEVLPPPESVPPRTFEKFTFQR
jgi:hypothetical protein